MKKSQVFMNLLVSIFVIGSATIPVDANSFATSQNPSIIVLDRERLSVGDIVAQGKLNTNGSCDFGSIQVTTPSIGDGTIRWLGIVLDTQCQIKVNAKWDGEFNAGPSDVIDPLYILMGKESEPVFETTKSYAIKHNEMSYGILTSGSKTSEQHIWMYGYGGSWDALTHKSGKLTFSYNGSTATLTSESGSCWGSTPASWSWVVDACIRDFYAAGPGPTVGRGGRGDYHCSPTNQFPCNLSNPDGYYHSLYDTEYGYSNGTSSCTYTVSGNWVADISQEILQGCS